MEIESLRFGPFRLDPINQCLWREAGKLPLAPKTYAVLQALISAPGQPVSKTELLDTVWPDEPVGDAALHVRIGELRKLLGDDPKTPQYIETVHRYGYRFIAPVQALTEALVAATQPPTLVGRDPVMAQLHEHFARACGHERQILLLTGEAGLGKTTVIDAFIQQLPTDCLASYGQCIEHYGSGEAYLPILEALERLCRRAQGEAVMALLRQHAPTWLAQIPSLLTAEERRELRRQLLGATRERMLRELAEAIEQLTNLTPLVLVLEDLHWSDYSTLDLVSMVARRRDPARLLLIGTYRPPDVLLSDHPVKALHHNLITRQQGDELALTLLTIEDIRAYLIARLGQGVPDACDQLAKLLYRHTEGNALFMVNSVNALVDQGVIIPSPQGWHVLDQGEVVDIRVPTDLQRFIIYQAERLPAPAQRVLEAASVAGGQFAAAAVASALDTEMETIEQNCDDLVRRQQFLQARDVEQWPDGTWMGCYRFVHTLYREALYHQLPAASRIRYHQRIGMRLETAYGERTREIATALAIHFEQGWQYAKAMRYYRFAGENAMQRHAYREAIDHLSKGLEMAAQVPRDAARDRHEIRLQLTLGTALTATEGLASENVKHAYNQARVLSEHANEMSSLFTALGGLCGHAVVRAEHHQAREFSEQRLLLAEQAQDAVLRLHAHLTLGSSLFYLGELQAARQHFEQTLALCEAIDYQTTVELDVVDPRSAALTFLSWVLWLLGYLDQARQCNREALASAQRLGHPHSESFALGFSAWLQHLMRNVETLQDETHALLVMSRQHGFLQWLGVGTILRGWARFSTGQGEQGIARIRQTLTAYRASGNELSLSYSLSLLAEAHGQMGQIDTALTTLGTALEVANVHDERYYEAELHRLQGELLLQRQAAAGTANGDALEAEQCFHRALKVARQQQAKLLELRSAVSLARVWNQQGKQVQAQALVAGVHEWFTEGGDTVDLHEAADLLRA